MTGNAVIDTTSPLLQRLRIYEASQRPTYRNGDWQESAWGRSRVFDRLGQRHADLLEAVLFCAESRYDYESGAIKLLVDPARIRKTLSDARYSLQQIWHLLRETISCVIEIDTEHARVMGSLIESVEAAKNRTRHNPLTQGDRHLWTVRLGTVFSLLMKQDVLLAYDPAPIARLDSGISQAVARFLFSHDPHRQPNGGWKFETLMEAVGVPSSSQALRNAKRRIRNDAERLNAMGIRVNDDWRFTRECPT